MATSQNGWTVIPDSPAGRALLDSDPLIRNVTIPNGMRKGDVAVVFRWLAREYDRRVERLTAGECWGWFVKKIEGGVSYSNHASGTAVDFNAPDNPMGTGTTPKSMTTEQIAECHALEAESGYVLRWGGDFSRNDPMHWEIIGDSVDVRNLANRIREQEMTTPQDIWAFDIDPSAGSHSAWGALWTVLQRSKALNTLPTDLDALHAKVNQLVADDNVEFTALDGALALINAKLDQLLSLHEPPQEV